MIWFDYYIIETFGIVPMDVDKPFKLERFTNVQSRFKNLLN